MKENVITVTINGTYNAGMAVYIWDLSAGEAKIDRSHGLIGQPA